MSKFSQALDLMVRDMIKKVINTYAWYFEDEVVEAVANGIYKLQSGYTAKALNRALFKAAESVVVIRTIDEALWLYKPLVRAAKPKNVTATTIPMPIDIASSGFPTSYVVDATSWYICHLTSGTNVLRFQIFNSGSPNTYTALRKDTAYNTSNAQRSFKFNAYKITGVSKITDIRYTASSTMYDLVINGLDSSTLLTNYAKAAMSGTLPLVNVNIASASTLGTDTLEYNIILPPLPSFSSRFMGGSATWYNDSFNSSSAYLIRYATYDTEYVNSSAYTSYQQLYSNGTLMAEETKNNSMPVSWSVDAFDDKGCLFRKGTKCFYNTEETVGIANSNFNALTYNLYDNAVYVPSGIYSGGAFTTAPSFTSAYSNANNSDYVRAGKRSGVLLSRSGKPSISSSTFAFSSVIPTELSTNIVFPGTVRSIVAPVIPKYVTYAPGYMAVALPDSSTWLTSGSLYLHFPTATNIPSLFTTAEGYYVCEYSTGMGSHNQIAHIINGDGLGHNWYALNILGVGFRRAYIYYFPAAGRAIPKLFDNSQLSYFGTPYLIPGQSVF